MSLTRNNACIELLLLETKMKSLVVHSRLFVCFFVFGVLVTIFSLIVMCLQTYLTYQNSMYQMIVYVSLTLELFYISFKTTIMIVDDCFALAMQERTMRSQ